MTKESDAFYIKVMAIYKVSTFWFSDKSYGLKQIFKKSTVKSSHCNMLFSTGLSFVLGFATNGLGFLSIFFYFWVGNNDFGLCVILFDSYLSCNLLCQHLARPGLGSALARLY